MREVGLEDIATQLAYANKVVFVPGYGLATAQAQHAVRELADALEKRGVTVKYGIHPVAGRMPGHKIGRATRLNSSHSQISYAVFCLKKKTNNEYFSHART